MIHTPSLNWDDRPKDTDVDILVLHYTGMETAAAALHRLCDPAAQVSAHYLVDEDGSVHRLVPEHRRAWHAGRAYWRGWTDINERSIGIEVVNPGHEFGYRPFPDVQMAAVSQLAQDIVLRYRIPGRNVVAHSDVAPDRKADPGELFDWARLAAAGVGLWPSEAETCVMDPDAVRHMLAEVGYDPAHPTAALKAFQRHYRPERVTGRIDFGTCRRLAGLVDLCRTSSTPA